MPALTFDRPAPSPSRAPRRLRSLARAAALVLLALALTLGLLGALSGLARAAAGTSVFATDFESGLPAEFSAPGASPQGVQGYAGLGAPGNQFGGSFLRFDATTLSDTRLVLRGLPPHDHVTLGFLLALIDSWDGTELFKVSVDGQERFSQWFDLATTNTTGYVAPPGALLSQGTELGFSIGAWYGRDRAYDLSKDSTFVDLPHTADSLTVTWWLSATTGSAAQNWQGGADESYALENVRVWVSSSTADVAAGAAPLALALETPRPHPSTDGRVRVAFTLPAAAPASLELLDVSGRRVESLARTGAGRHTAVLGAGTRLAPGVYLVRVRQGALAATRRVIVL